MRVQLIQLARIYGRERASLDEDAARQIVVDGPAQLAEAFFQEAAASDDVTGIESALQHLDDRLAFFGTIIPPKTTETIRAEFRRRIESWR